MRKIRQGQRWSWALVAVTVISSIIIFAPTLQAFDANSAQSGESMLRWAIAADKQVFSDDLVVAEGEVLHGNTVVYAGDVEIEADARLEGDLVVYSGDITVAAGASIAGDLSAFSGDIDVAGAVEGDIASWSGDIELHEDAYIGGDVSVLSGDLDRHKNAQVAGNLVRGPAISMALPQLPTFIDAWSQRADSAIANDVVLERYGTGFWDGVGRFMIRLFGVTALTIVALLCTGVLALARPDFVVATTQTVQQQAALSFAVGLMTNLSLLFLIGFMAVSICLIPLALVPLLFLAVLNVAGWAAVSHIIGERLANALSTSFQPIIHVLLGTFVLTGSAGFVWAFGGCFSFLGGLLGLMLASIGVGAIVVPRLKLGSSTTALETVS